MSLRVLVVDDSPVIRQVVQIYLRGHSLEFDEAPSGERALQLTRLMRFDLVIADIKMPGMDGIAFVKELRKGGGKTRADVPVIMLTGERSTDNVRRATEAGADAFLRKPVSSAGLAEALGQLLPSAKGGDGPS